jgi:hypothetical protein
MTSAWEPCLAVSAIAAAAWMEAQNFVMATRFDSLHPLKLLIYRYLQQRSLKKSPRVITKVMIGNISVALLSKSIAIADHRCVESWISRYYELLEKADSQTGQSETLALKRANFPEALYRYRSLERLAYCLEELRDGYVFLNNPGDFNDPYDSALSVSFEQLQNRVLEKYVLEYDPKTESKFFESLDEGAKKDLEVQREAEQAAFQSMFGGLLSVLYGPSARPGRQDFFDSFRNLVRVGCFTTNPSSVVMWSHYANQHTGICVEFPGSAMLSNAEFFGLLHPVRYTEKLFDLVQVFSPWMSANRARRCFLARSAGTQS